VRLLLDTVTLIFAVVSPERLTRRATGILQNTENILELSAISLSEIAVKAARGKLKFSAADTRQALEDLDIRILPYTANHAFFLFDLPPLHQDPFDRQIIAQALYEEIPVMTCDEKFALYTNLKVIW
jgi:PIN domain nuclease of toxin-antitoxin system